MNFLIFTNCVLFALITIPSIVYSDEDDYDPCKAAAFVNGDIAITKYQLSRLKRTKRAATALRSRLWEHGIIPYEIDSVFSASGKSLIVEAMRHWENHSCLTFVEHSDQSDYIFFQKGHCGCCSFVGRKGNGKQGISIGDDCDTFGIVVHEIGHALGFWHEHTRPDRNRYVKIIAENIERGRENNFALLNYDEVNSLGEEYDFASIMHYAPNLFSRTLTSNVIVPKVNISRSLLSSIGQRKQLSKGDIAQINKLYQCLECGGTLQNPSGTISNPSFPSFDRKSRLCEWRLFTTPGEIIVLNMNVFKLRGNRSCEENYVEIRDGRPKGKLIGRYCRGNPPPKTLASYSNRLLLKTKLSRGSRQKFQFRYKATCGGIIKLDRGEIQSPNSPSGNRFNKLCVWRIIVKEGTKVGIKFSSFDVEDAPNCMYDAVSIYNGLNEANMVTRLCGKTIPKDLATDTNEALIKFETDNSVESEGFMLNFVSEVDECKSNKSGCEHICENTIGSYKCKCHIGYELHSNGKNCEVACGGELKDRNGTITSPSYPDRYPSNKKCSWSIKAPPLHKIQLSFKTFELEESGEGCHYDYLVVKKNKKNASRHCGNRNPGVMMSITNEMHIEFVSDSSMSKKGFEAEYYTDKDECQENGGGCEYKCVNVIGSFICQCRDGFKLHSNGRNCIEGGSNPVLNHPTGTIKTPNYPEYYKPDLNLRWTIIVSPGHRVRLVFEEFSLENDELCKYDYVLVESGFIDEKKLCGSHLENDDKNQTSMSNKMVIQFRSDNTHQERGFLAVYKTVCGGRLHADEDQKHILSHVDFNLKKPYPGNASCEWHLAAKKGYVIRIKLEMFELQQDDNCTSDFLRIRDGSSSNSPIIATLCGVKTGLEFQSTGNNMYLRFQTDGKKAKKGFLIGYRRKIL